MRAPCPGIFGVVWGYNEFGGWQHTRVDEDCGLRTALAVLRVREYGSYGIVRSCARGAGKARPGREVECSGLRDPAKCVYGTCGQCKQTFQHSSC